MITPYCLLIVQIVAMPGDKGPIAKKQEIACYASAADCYSAKTQLLRQTKGTAIYNSISYICVPKEVKIAKR